MNDDDVMTLVRDQRDRVPLTIPVERIMRRGHAVRMRRRVVPGLAGAVVAAAGIAVGVAVNTGPAGTPATRHLAGHGSRPPAVRLAAWTVTKQADGNISVTIRQLLDPTGLQSTLRADGVPASVTFDRLNPSCRRYPAAPPLLRQVFPKPYRHLPSTLPGKPLRTRLGESAPSPSPFPLALAGPNTTVIVIDPSALPHHAGVRLAASSSAAAILLPQLVHASPQCTGS